VPVVDGNVVRVFSRLFGVIQDPSDKTGVKHHWDTAEFLVAGGTDAFGSEVAPCDDPGGLNQALMELGATVCTPKNPKCDECPLRNQCQARAEQDALEKTKDPADVVDVEDCGLCCTTPKSREAASQPTTSVTKYPMAKPKPAKREERVFCALVHKTGHEAPDPVYLLQKRPAQGLLASLLEFPQVVSECDGAEVTAEQMQTGRTQLAEHLVACGISATANAVEAALQPIHAQDKPLRHIFSHIRHELHVFFIDAEGLRDGATKGLVATDRFSWLTIDAIDDAAISKEVRKCVDALSQWESAGRTHAAPSKKRRAAAPAPAKAPDPKKQNTLDGFLSRSPAAPPSTADGGQQQQQQSGLIDLS
jgi:adenine-specific DNA glycosylase